MQYFVLWRLAQALVIYEAHRLVVHRCDLTMAGTTGDVTRNSLLSNSGKDSLDIVTNVACNDSCHNQQQPYNIVNTNLLHKLSASPSCQHRPLMAS